MSKSSIQAWVMPIALACVWLIFALLNAWNDRRRQLAPGAAQALALDPRPPVVFLRPFDEDETVEGLYGHEEVRCEEKLAAVLQAIGPMVAVGRPGDMLPPLGAAREYVVEGDWQETVTRWLAAAALVVVVPGRSAGVGWELVRAFQFVDPRRIVIALPPPRQLYLSGAEWRRLQQVRYAHLKNVLDPNLAAPLPAAQGRATFIVFDERRHPRLLLPPARWKSPVLGQYAHSRAGYAETLRPHLAAQGLHPSRRATRLAALLHFPFLGMLQSALLGLSLLVVLFGGVALFHGLNRLAASL